MEFKTNRKDVQTDKKSIKLSYDTCTMLGYSRLTLEYGDCFLYKEYYTDGSYRTRLAMCRGRIKPLNKIQDKDVIKWYVLAQSANDMMDFTYERWIDPNDIIGTLPKERIKPGIKEFFENQLKINGY